MGQSDGRACGGGVRLYADSADAAQREMTPSPFSVPSPLPPPSYSSRASLPSPPPVPPNMSSSKVGIKKITARRLTCVHIPSHRARSKEARGGDTCLGQQQARGQQVCARGGGDDQDPLQRRRSSRSG